jgi:hypothetical protein
VISTPDHRQVVVDADERVVDFLFDLGFGRLGHILRKGGKGHLRGLAVTHQHHGASGQERFLNSGSVALCHAVKHGVYGNQDGFLLRCLGTQR